MTLLCCTGCCWLKKKRKEQETFIYLFIFLWYKKEVYHLRYVLVPHKLRCSYNAYKVCIFTSGECGKSAHQRIDYCFFETRAVQVWACLKCLLEASFGWKNLEIICHIDLCHQEPKARRVDFNLSPSKGRSKRRRHLPGSHFPWTKDGPNADFCHFISATKLGWSKSSKTSAQKCEVR